MKPHQPLKTMLYAGAACLALASATAYADVRVNAAHHVHSDIGFSGEDVVITADDDSEARITPAGDLFIRGKAVDVNDAQRQLLLRYSHGIRDIEMRGLHIGESAVNMVGGMLGTLVAEALGGADDQEIERQANAKAEPIKQQARALCKDVQAERQVQEQLSAQLPAFKPYAVIDTDSEHDCHIDDREV